MVVFVWGRKTTWAFAFLVKKPEEDMFDLPTVSLTFNFHQNATKNAGEMINKYQILFNRTRQAVITGELVEIITGATASEEM